MRLKLIQINLGNPYQSLSLNQNICCQMNNRTKRILGSKCVKKMMKRVWHLNKLLNLYLRRSNHDIHLLYFLSTKYLASESEGNLLDGIENVSWNLGEKTWRLIFGFVISVWVDKLHWQSSGSCIWCFCCFSLNLSDVVEFLGTVCPQNKEDS